MDDDPGVLAQRCAEQHLEILNELEERDLDGEGTAYEDLEDPSFGPYCGCATCIVREVLYVGWPYAQAELLDQLENVPDKVRAEVEAEIVKRERVLSHRLPVIETPDAWVSSPSRGPVLHDDLY